MFVAIHKILKLLSTGKFDVIEFCYFALLFSCSWTSYRYDGFNRDSQMTVCFYCWFQFIVVVLRKRSWSKLYFLRKSFMSVLLWKKSCCSVCAIRDWQDSVPLKYNEPVWVSQSIEQPTGRCRVILSGLGCQSWIGCWHHPEWDVTCNLGQRGVAPPSRTLALLFALVLF